MPDLLDTNDPIRAAFGQFRVAAGTEITSTGAGAARRTVRRRRAIRLTATATLAIAALAGGSFAYGELTGDHRNSPMAGAHPSDGPSIPAFPYASQRMAESLVGGDPTDPIAIAGSGAFPTARIDFDDTDHTAGGYEVSGVCLGTGTAVMTFKYNVAPTDPAWDATANVKVVPLDCVAGTVYRMPVTVPAGHGMTIQFTPDTGAANGHTFYAYHVVRR